MSSTKKTGTQPKPAAKGKPAEALPPTRSTTRPALAAGLTAEGEKIIEWMKAHPQEVIKERTAFLERMHKKRVAYGRKGGALPITLSPMFLKEESLELLAKVAETLDRALDKAIKAYYTDPACKEYFLYPEVPEEWLQFHPGYEKPTVLNRHDALFDGKTLKFIEFNTDNPGGRGWTDTFNQLYREYPIYADLIKTYERPQPDRPMMALLLESLLACWKEYGGKGKPRVGLVSYKSFVPGSDDEIVRDYLVEHGLDAHCVDSRDFEYRDGKLWSNNVRFDIANMTLRFVFFRRFPREHKDFLAALKDKAICQVNPFRATVGSEKQIMSFMTNPVHQHHFSAEETEAIQKHIPWTRSMHETVTMSPDGTDISLKEFCLHERERLVLKPTGGAGGHEVTVGKTTDKAEWADAVESTLGCPWYIVQEAVDIPEFEMPVLKDNKVVMEKKKLNVNPYVFNGKYAGAMGRVSESNVINVAKGGGIVPIFALKTGAPDRRKPASGAAQVLTPGDGKKKS